MRLPVPIGPEALAASWWNCPAASKRPTASKGTPMIKLATSRRWTKLADTANPNRSPSSTDPAIPGVS